MTKTTLALAALTLAAAPASACGFGPMSGTDVAFILAVVAAAAAVPLLILVGGLLAAVRCRTRGLTVTRALTALAASAAELGVALQTPGSLGGILLMGLVGIQAVLMMASAYEPKTDEPLRGKVFRLRPEDVYEVAGAQARTA